MTQTVSPPIGFGRIEPLNKHTHRFAFPKARTAEFASGLNALPLGIAEYAEAMHSYPIVFASSDDISDFASVAVVGVKNRQNLFVNKDGRWDEKCYIPSYVRAYPLCLATIKDDGVARADKLVCIASDAVVSDGEELFTESGQPTPLWLSKEKMLRNYESTMLNTLEMCHVLRTYGLLKKFVMQAAFEDKTDFNIQGIYRVDEKVLAALSTYQLRNLMKKGWMDKIYAHLLSLRNFISLVDKYKATVNQ